jgi:hypothetical protein
MGKEYRHLRVLREQLEKHTDKDTQIKILSGMDYIKDGSNPDIKAEWANEIVKRLDENLDKETRIKIRENCACLKSNEKSVYAQTFRRLRKQHIDDSEYLKAVVDYLNSTSPLRRCGEVSLDGDKINTIIARGHCECQVLKNGLKNPISVTWCHCCKGSILSVIKYIYPEKKCYMTIKETYASGGKICLFETAFEK